MWLWFCVSQEEEKLHEKLGLGGKEHRKGSVTKAKVGGKWRGKKRSRGREKVILKSFGFEVGQGNCLGFFFIV